MTRPLRHCHSVFGISLRIAAALAFLLGVGEARAQTFSVIYTFTGGRDGAFPYAGLTVDKAGNLYGTAAGGGAGGGTVFKLIKLTPDGSDWTLIPLYSFGIRIGGTGPAAKVIFGTDGSLYGTTVASSTCFGSGDCGTVFNLRPPASSCKTELCPWRETVLYRFTGGINGSNPVGDLIFDRMGNLYGATFYGGASGLGTVYVLTPAGQAWTLNVVYSFSGGSDGDLPQSGVILDKAGNLYGTTSSGGGSGCDGFGCGTVFRLTPSGTGWAENVLYSFQGKSDGLQPWGGLIFDPSVSLYGTTSLGGPAGGGTVFMLTPANGVWTFSLLYGLVGDALGPAASLVIDAAGNLYGTTAYNGAYGYGSVFKLTPTSGGWIYTDVHDFARGDDGANPYSGLIVDASGNLYGTTAGGGNLSNCVGGCGVIFKITP